VNGFLAVLIVLGLVTALAWLLRRGSLGALTGRGGPINVETAVALGERRSLVIVSVEGRRLLLGLTPTTMSLVAELPGAALQTPPPAARTEAQG
jgi:flagellar protein FliO/FliZ